MEQNYKQKLIYFHEKENRMPTYTEMMALFGFKSKNAVARLVEKFIDAGFVSKDHLGRLIAEKSFNEIPLLGSIKAGFPSNAEEVELNTINIDSYLTTSKKANSFLLKVDGESMIDAHIADGDMVLVEKTEVAKDGDIVIADIDGESTMKYFRKEGGKVWLEPANKNFKNIYPEQYLRITAIVKAVIRKY